MLSFKPFQQLDNDWANLCRRTHRAALSRWAAQQPDLAGLERLDELCVAEHADRRRYFLALMEVVRSGDDELARRALIQMLVPGLIRIANGLRRTLLYENPRDIESDVISVAWSHVAALAAGRSTARTARYMLLAIYRDATRLRRGSFDHETARLELLRSRLLRFSIS